jgi:hypothetical protein
VERISIFSSMMATGQTPGRPFALCVLPDHGSKVSYNQSCTRISAAPTVTGQPMRTPLP